MGFYKNIKFGVKKRNKRLYVFLLRHKKLVKFFLSGTVAVSIDFSILIFLTHNYGIWPIYSSTVSSAASFFVGFFLQKLWTFRDGNKKRMGRQIFLYFLAGVINLILNAALMYLFYEHLNIHYIIAQAMSGLMLTANTFIFYSYVIFKKKKRAARIKTEKNVLITTGIYPPELGGPSYYVRRIVSLLSEYGYNIKVITYGDEDYVNYNRTLTVVSRKHNVFVRYLKFWLVVRKHRKWADIVYSFDLFSTGLPCALVRLFCSDFKLVIRLGGDFIWEKALEMGWTELPLKKYYQSPKNLSEKLHILIARFVLSLSDTTFFSSSLQGEVFENYYNLKDSTVIENAYPNVPCVDLSDNGRIFLACRFIKMKNVVFLFKAIKDIPEAKLDLYGEGVMEGELKRFVIDNQLSDKINIFPKLTQDELFAKMAQYSFVVLPSITDISPNFALECVKLGKPILLTCECGFVGRFQGKMKYINPQDSEDLKNAIRRMYDNDFYIKYVNDIKSIKLDRDFSDIAREHDELFRKLLK